MKWFCKFLITVLLAVMLKGPIDYFLWNTSSASVEATIVEVKSVHIPGTRKTRHDMYRYRYRYVEDSVGEDRTGCVYTKYSEGDVVDARITFTGAPILYMEVEASLVNTNSLILLLTAFGLIYVIRKRGGSKCTTTS